MRLVGEKVSIVTHKVQTTRFQIRAIAMLETKTGQAAQVVLVDTPGIFSPNESDRLAKSMVHAAWTGASDSNLVVHVVDAPAWLRHAAGEGSAQDRLSVEDTKSVAKGLRNARRNLISCSTKWMKFRMIKCCPLIAEFNEMEVYAQILMTSAQNGEGIEALSFALADAMPEGPFLYPV